MLSPIESLTYCYSNPSQVKQLNLSSTSNIKIHQITGLDKFVRLRILILNNNMIRIMSGLDQLRNLRVLNLEFNQIKIVQGTQNLENLEQLYIAYNQVQRVSQSVLNNKKLRVLHLAYNDISTLDALSVLYQISPKSAQQQQQLSYYQQQSPEKSLSPKHTNKNSPTKSNINYMLSNLTTISLYGNPLISTINYQSFFKMLIPSLRIIDDRNVQNLIDMADQYIGVQGSICPQQEVVILREAINKLIEERNAVVDQLEGYVNAPTHKVTPKSKKDSNVRPFISQSQPNRQNVVQLQKINRTNKQILKYFQEMKQKHTIMLQKQKDKISKISQLYSQYLKKNKQSRENNQQSQTHTFNFKINELIGQTNNYTTQRANQASVYSQNQPVIDGKLIMKQLKQQEAKLQQNQSKIRNINNFLAYIEQRKKMGQTDIYKIILQMVLFGSDLKTSLSMTDCQKLCKKFLIKPFLQFSDGAVNIKTNLIEYNQLLKKIVYGENTQKSNIKITIKQLSQLKNKIRSKGLLQIINQLRELNSIENTKTNKFEKQRKAFIDKFQKQTEQLSQSWDQLRKQKQKFQQQKTKQNQDYLQNMQKKQSQMRRKYKITQQQQRQKITQLKKARQKLQYEVQGLNINLTQAQQKLNRRFMQLQQFQNHFNQFIQQKQHIKSLQIQINDITASLQVQQSRYQNLVNKVKQLTLQQGILHNKIIKSEQILKNKNKEIHDTEKRRNQINKNYDRLRLEYDRQAQKLRDITNGIITKSQQLKDYQKMCQRTKKNLNLLQQKVRNIDHMQSNKKISIKQLQEQIKILKQDKQSLTFQVQNLEKNIQLKRQQLITYQLKIQQNKLATQNLSDINKSIGDMMIRQSQLKRSIIELEIQNKNLMEMKNNLMGDFKMKHYL